MPPKSKIPKNRKQEKEEEILERNQVTSETQPQILSQKTQEKPSNKNSERTERNQDTNKNKNGQETNDLIQTMLTQLLERFETKVTSLETSQT